MLDTETLTPSGAGDETNIRWQSGSGAHYQLCQIADGTWDPSIGAWGALGGNLVYEYNWYNDNYYRDLYAMANPTQRLEGIVKVKWRAYAGKNKYPYGNRKRGIKTHGVAYDGSAIIISPGWNWIREVFRTNPFTGSAWTLAEVDALQCGVTLGRGGGYGNPACSAIQAVVCWVDAAVQTKAATNYTGIAARLNGKVLKDEDVDCTVRFQWGETTSYGNTTPNQTGKRIGDTFYADISGLDPAKFYHFRAVIINDCGEVFYGEDKIFPTAPPAVITDPATSIEAKKATLNGTLAYDGGEACDCGFEWGLDTGYGTITSTQSKTTGETFSQVIGGLAPNTTYHFRAFARNSAGIGYGTDRSFTTALVISRAYALSREEL